MGYPAQWGLFWPGWVTECQSWSPVLFFHHSFLWETDGLETCVTWIFLPSNNLEKDFRCFIWILLILKSYFLSSDICKVLIMICISTFVIESLHYGLFWNMFLSVESFYLPLSDFYYVSSCLWFFLELFLCHLSGGCDVTLPNIGLCLASCVNVLHIYYSS